MTVEARQMLEKLNFVEVSRLLKGYEAIEEYAPFPQSSDEEKEAMTEYLFRYLKHRFSGCRIRRNRFSFSVRLDGIVHRNAEHLRKVVYNEREWRDWLQNNHRELFYTIHRGNNAFTGQDFERREKEGHSFISIVHDISRIRQYNHLGLVNHIQNIEEQYKRDLTLHEVHDEVISLIEGEINRREEERREKERVERELYLSMIRPLLLTPFSQFDFPSNTIEGKLKAKMQAYFEEKGIIEMVIPQEPTFKRVIPVGTKVRVLAQIGSQEENWYAVPIHEGYEAPEGYEIKEGWGKVTEHSTTKERSRNGRAPVVIEEYLFTSFNFDHWKHLMPQGYLELLEVMRTFEAEAREECEQEGCDETSVQQLLAQEQAVAQQAERAQREAEERKQVLAEQLKAQLAQAQQEAEESDEEEAVEEELIRPTFVRDADWAMPEAAQPAPVPTVDPRTYSLGIYKNNLAIPLEQYVLVFDGTVKRFRNLEAVNRYIDLDTAYTSRGPAFERVRDYYNPEIDVEDNDH